MTAAPQRDLPKRVEVVVIGGGIAGVSTAYFLAKAGVPVALFEKGRIAGEQSSRNWGWVRKQGRDPRELPAIIESLKIWQGLEHELQADLGWHVGGVTYVAETDEDLAGFESWLAEAKPYQLDSRMLSPDETDALLGQEGRRWKGALYTASDGRAEPAKAVPALAAAAERLGVGVFTECAVRTIETAAGRVSGVVTERGAVACRSVVCAAGAWSSLFSRNLGIALPQLRIKSSVCRTEPAPLVTQSAVALSDFAFRRRQDGGYSLAPEGGNVFDLVPDLLRHFRLFWPAYRVTKNKLRLRLTGEFLKQLGTPQRWSADSVTPFERVRVLDPEPEAASLQKALQAARSQIPQFKDLTIAESWAGMIEVTPDAIPVLCAVERPQGYFIATGFSGHGFGMGPAAGLLMSELVLRGEARVDMSPFRLSRFFDGTQMTPYSVV